ncbi:MAG: M3 family metallopeptidase [Nakamurella sp.]
MSAATSANPFAGRSELACELPPFADIAEEHYAPAFDAGMAEHRAEVDAVIGNPDPATFDNTIVALERAGQLLTRVSAVFFNLSSTNSTERLRTIESEYAPKLTAHSDGIRLDPALFAKVRAVFEAERDDPRLTTEEAMLVKRYHLDFVLAGAGLDEPGRTKLAELNQRLSTLSTLFQQNLLQATEDAALLIDSADELAGLSADAIATAADAATARGHAGRYSIALILPTGQPLLKLLRNRDVRRRLFEASVNRANSGMHDNSQVLLDIVALRARRARLLGFATHADAKVADQTVRTTVAIDEFLARLIGPAVENADAEAALLAEIAGRDGIELAAWDWAYYTERVRAEQYDVDTAALRLYFDLERVLADGVFHAANRLYGIELVRRTDLDGYHPDVRVWEVRNADGSTIGLFLGDYFAREGKRGGAWMSNFVDQSFLFGSVPVVINVLNLPRPAAGEPALCSLDEVRTLFHEFGHALHGLFSQVTYPRLSGTAVPRDFVEYPSQVNEMWILWSEVLEHYARHVETGEPLPTEVVSAVRAAEQWGEGFGTTEYLAATVLDQAWHRVTDDHQVTDVAAFERQALIDAGIAHPLVPPRYRSTYFQHIFSGGYSAGYYSYIWSEVLDAETVEWFKDNGGLRRENGDLFRSRLLSVGGSVEAMDAFRAVRGRDAGIGPLLKRRGLDRSAADQSTGAQ